MNTQIHLEAAEWFVEFRTGDPDPAVRTTFDAWIRKSPEHLRAYLEVAEIWQDVPEIRHDHRGLSEALLREARANDDNIIPLHSLLPSSIPATPSLLPSGENRRRRPARFFVLAASVLLLLLVGIWTWLDHRQVYATDIGEQRTLTLEDGSRVELNSRTRVRVAYHSNERDLELLEGEALFQVSKDPTRPFIVHTTASDIRAVGTQFDVNKRQAGTTITVVEGAVAVIPSSEQRISSQPVRSSAPRESARPSPRHTYPPAVSQSAVEEGGSAQPAMRSGVLLMAGQQLTVPLQTPVTLTAVDVDAAEATSWTEHKLVFKSSPLQEVIEAFNRYNRRKLTLRGGGLANILISGTYTTTDPALLIRFLRDQPDITVTETETQIVISRTP
jgi:transmembrane sensor